MPNLCKRKRFSTEKSPGSAATRGSKKRTSPVSTNRGLNHDTLHIVFTFLSDIDLFRCERVCRAWRDAVGEWMICNFRWNYPHAWETHKPNHLTSEFYKQQAQLQRNVHAGTPSSVRQLAGGDTFVLAGNFIAWTQSRETPGWVNWQNLERSKDGGGSEALTYLSKNYLKAPNHPVYVIDLAINKDGILLMRLEAPDYHTGRSKRILALSPDANMPKYKGVILNKAFEDDWIERGLIPLSIGIRRIYFARRNVEGDSYDLVAHDFRTGNLVYETPVLAKTWTMGDEKSIDPDFKKRRLFYGLIQSHEDKEFILELSSLQTAKKPCISIFSGTDGQFVQKLDFPEASLSSIMLHVNPSFNSVVFQSTISDAQDVNALLETHNIHIMRRFSWDSQGRLTASSADAVFTDKAPQPLEQPAIHPFSMVAVSKSRTTQFRYSFDVHWQHRSVHIDLNFHGRALLPAMESRLRDVANATINSRFSSDAPALGNCFVLGEPTAVTLPKRPEIGRDERAPISIEGSNYPCWNIFLGGRYFLSKSSFLENSASYLLDFME